MIEVKLITENYDATEANIRVNIDGLEHQFNIYYNIDLTLGYQIVIELQRILNQHRVRKAYESAKHAKS